MTDMPTLGENLNGEEVLSCQGLLDLEMIAYQEHTRCHVIRILDSLVNKVKL
jgi:hypothetical protein